MNRQQMAALRARLRGNILQAATAEIPAYLSKKDTPARSLRDWAPKLVKLNLETFNKWVEGNRKHQNEALQAVRGFSIGQVISPCGTGKTRIQTCLHISSMVESKPGETTVCVIVSHRLALNRQLRNEVVNILIPCGIPFDILCVSSDRGDDTKNYYASKDRGGYAHLGYSLETSRHLTTTNQKEIDAFVVKAKELGRHVLIVSTYHSISRLENIGKIDLVTYDEAQNIVRDDFPTYIQKIKPNTAREYYFTATRKVKDNNGGMDDETFFGSILIDVKPQLMLERGEIVCPRIHIVRGLNDEKTNTFNVNMLVKNINEAFIRHKDLIKSSSTSPNDVGAKIIIGCNGIEEMEDIYLDPGFKEHNKGIQCFAISSKQSWVNWERTTPEMFFECLNALDDSEDALILNVDMLTEGIDLPSITGVMPMRNLGTIKLIQLLGRALRLHKKDRALLYSGEISPADYKNFSGIELGYTKPYGYLILLEDIETLTESEQMKRIIRSVYNEYLTPVEKLVIVDKFIDKEKEDLKSILPQKNSDGKEYDLEHTVVDIASSVISDVIEDSIKNMSPQDKIDNIINCIGDE